MLVASACAAGKGVGCGLQLHGWKWHHAMIADEQLRLAGGAVSLCDVCLQPCLASYVVLSCHHCCLE
jgi:hypothetical protein